MLHTTEKLKKNKEALRCTGEKIFCIILLLMLVSNMASAQLSAGIKINLGMGGISSSNLEKNLNYQNDLAPKITEWNVTQSRGFGFGFGGFVAHSFSDHVSFIAEPSVNFLKCEIDFERIENKVNSSGDGDIHSDATASDIEVSYFSIPLLVRYQFSPGGFFLQSGIGINFTGTPTITSTETSSKDHYKNWVLDKTTIEPSFTLETKLNVFASPRFDFVLGAGKSFDLNGKELSIDIRYNLPLTQSEMFTTDGSYNDGRFKKNDLLALGGKTDAERDAPFLLNDFKMSVISLSLSYALFKK